jgi:hypothetical protein
MESRNSSDRQIHCDNPSPPESRRSQLNCAIGRKSLTVPVDLLRFKTIERFAQ